MSIFSASFNAVAVSVAQDAFELVAPSNSRVAIRSISLGQYWDAGDASAELLSVTILRGHTTSGSGCSAGSTVEANNTTVASNGLSSSTSQNERWGRAQSAM